MMIRILLLAPLLATAAAPERGDDLPAAAAAPVVLELFTSQGCSSCPPADRLLSQIGDEPGVVALSFHVDYWNHLGWRDPFSSSAWSERQRRYARVFGTNRVYTPMLVVDGRRDVVGSVESRVRNAIAESRAGERPLALAVSARSDETRLSIVVEIAASAEHPEGLDLVLLVHERGISTPVSTGENARRTLHHDFVVRQLSTTPWGRVRFTRDLPIKSGWNAESLGVTALLQDPESLHIHAAGSTAAQRED